MTLCDLDFREKERSAVAQVTPHILTDGLDGILMVKVRPATTAKLPSPGCFREAHSPCNRVSRAEELKVGCTS